MSEKFFGARDKLWNFDPLLIKCTRFAPDGKVLDLGLGKDGRNALFFSMLGYEVDGLDIDESAVKQSLERAANLGVTVNARVADISVADVGHDEYSIVLAMYMWQYFSRETSEHIISKMKDALAVGGISYLAVFAPSDICFVRVKDDPDFRLVDKNTYHAEKGNWWGCKTSSDQTYVHSFSKEELLSLFADFELLHCSESVDLDIDHCNPHHHDVIIYIGRKIC